MIDSNDNIAFGASYLESTTEQTFQDQESDGASAIIGSKIRFKGELVGEEDLIIQGSVDGTIDLKGNNLTVGRDGKLNANVSAKIITVEGKVEGDIFGQEKIVIKESSNVRGNLSATRVSLEDGAKFKGSIDMDVSESNPTLVMPTFKKAGSGAQPQTSQNNKKSVTAIDKSSANNNNSANEKAKEKESA